jgi:hypothetical protein
MKRREWLWTRWFTREQRGPNSMTLFDRRNDCDRSDDAVVFSGHGGRLALQVRGYERPDGEPDYYEGELDYYDANWLVTSVSVSAGAFSGSFEVCIGTYELERLHSDLKECVDHLTGTVVFENMEADLLVKIVFQKRGNAEISGEAKPGIFPRRDGDLGQGRLAFSFGSDQSYLAETVRQLGATIRRFPVRKKG